MDFMGAYLLALISLYSLYIDMVFNGVFVVAHI